MKCPKCGYERQSRDDAFVPATECPACGVVYSKHEYAKMADQALADTPPPHLKASPVDAQSLRKARERVEKRLRERLENRIHDERHAQTLELAKRFAAEQIRKRRNEWKHTHKQTQTTAAPDEAPPESENPAQERQPAATEKRPNRVSGQRQTPGASPARADEPAHSSVAESENSPMQTTEDITVPAAQTEIHTREAPENIEEENLPDQADAAAPHAPRAMAFGASAPETAIPTPHEMEEALPEFDPIAPAAHAAARSMPRQAQTNPDNGLTRLLPIVAWLILCAGIIGAVLSWTTISDVQAGMRVPIPHSPNAFPLGLLLGFAYLAIGILGFAFFWVSSLISRQLKDIQQLLLHPVPITRAREQAEENENMGEA